MNGDDVRPQISVRGFKEVWGPFMLNHHFRFFGIGKKHWYRLPSFPRVSSNIPTKKRTGTVEIEHVVSGQEQKISKITLNCESGGNKGFKAIYDDFYAFSSEKEKESDSSQVVKPDYTAFKCSFKCQAKSSSKTTKSGMFSRSGKQCFAKVDGSILELSSNVPDQKELQKIYTAWCKLKVYAETKDSAGNIKQTVKAVEISISK